MAYTSWWVTWGHRYGVRLTIVDQRGEMAQLRRAEVERSAGGQTEELQRSTEQLASVEAACEGGPSGQFIVTAT